jgi:hypothetical protein
MLPLLGAIIGPVIKAVSTLGSNWLENRKIKQQGKQRILEAKIDAKIKRYESRANMDLTAMDNMKYSWKDEYLVILLSAPVILCFIPGLEQYALRGFEILDKTPDWYRWALTGMIAASFGLRTWTGFKK